MDEISDGAYNNFDQNNEPNAEELAEIEEAFKVAETEMAAGSLISNEEIKRMAAEILAIRQKRMI